MDVRHLKLEQADWRDVLTILRETVDLWSAGLSPMNYRQYISLQMDHYWSRQHFRYLVCKNKDEVLASCKLYNLIMTARGRHYHFPCIGAVYTQKKYRHQNYAQALIENVIALCRQNQADGILLFSEIGPKLYERFGFVELGSAEFRLDLSELEVLRPSFWTELSEPERRICLATKQKALDHADVPRIAQHHRQWLSTQPFGIFRSEDYWHYKISRENFLHNNSRLSWPQLALTELVLDWQTAGYAITEENGETLRILEIVGTKRGRDLIWLTLLKRAQDLKLTRIRGWEGVTRDFSPGYKLSSILPASTNASPIVGEFSYIERDWGRCMIMPIEPALEQWLDINPCPLLELDHQ